MNKKQELIKDIADMKDAIKAAKDAKNEAAVADLKPTLEEFEKELKELEDEEKKKPEPKAKAKPVAKKHGKSAHKAASKKAAPKEEKEIKRDRLFGKGKKFDLKVGEKVTMEDGTQVLLNSDEDCVLIYKGNPKRTVAFKFRDGSWHIDCCERGLKKYPDFTKGQIEVAVDYILEMLECREMTDKKVKQRTATKKKHNLAPTTPAAKVEDVIDNAANKIEKTTAAMVKKGKSFTVPQLRNFAKEHEDMALGIAAGIRTASDKKVYVSALRAVATKVEKMKIAPAKMADGGNVDNEEVLTHYMVAALWSSTDSDEEALDTNYNISDIAPETKERFKTLVDKFVSENKEVIEESELSDEQLGHDLWLTQNGHGAGFFDRSLDKEVEEKLTKAAKAFGGVDMVVGDDGLIHGEGGKFAKGGNVEVIKESNKFLNISATKDKMILTLTDEGREEVAELRTAFKSDLEIMDELFETIAANSELLWHPDLGEIGMGLTSASGVTDGYGYDDDGNFTDDGRVDSRVYYFSDYMIRGEVDDLLAGELILTGADNKFAKGGNTDDTKLEYIAGLIRDGLTSGYQPYWELEVDVHMNDEDREHVAKLVSDGFTSGEIVRGEGHSDGWWSIKIGEEFAKGGSTKKGEKIMLAGYMLRTVEDSFEHGQVGEDIQDYDNQDVLTFDSPEALIKHIEGHITYSKDFKNHSNAFEDGRIDTDVLVAKDAHGDFFPASANEIERWKKAEIKLYNSHYSFYIEYVTKRKPTTKEMAKEFTIGEYAQGGNTSVSEIVFLKSMGFEVMSDLPFTYDEKLKIDTGREFYIGEKTTSIGKIAAVAMFQDGTGAVDDLIITKPELRQMSSTARTSGVKKVALYTNYGVEVRSDEKDTVGFDRIEKLTTDEILKHSGLKDNFKAGDFVVADIYKDKSSRIPMVVLYKNSVEEGENVYYIHGDGSHYVKENRLEKVTEKEFNEYWKEDAEKMKKFAQGGGVEKTITVKPHHAHRDEFNDLIAYLDENAFSYKKEKAPNGELPYVVIVEMGSQEVIEQLHEYLENHSWDVEYAQGGGVDVLDAVVTGVIPSNITVDKSTQQVKSVKDEGTGRLLKEVHVTGEGYYFFKGGIYENPQNKAVLKASDIDKIDYMMSFGKGGNMIAFPNSNLYLTGAGLDTNGNWTVKVGFPNDRAFSIQTNGVLRETNRLTHNKLSEITPEQLEVIEKEVVGYVSEFGSKKQKSKLKNYKK